MLIFQLKFNEYQIPRDNFIKNYCEKHNIELIILKYTDDIENEIAIKKKDLEVKIKNQVVQNVVLFVMFL